MEEVFVTSYVRLQRKATRAGAAVFALALLLAACGEDKPTTPASKNRAVTAGVNDPQDKNIALLAFLPAEITVQAGAEVTWNFPGPAVHVVYFPETGKQPPAPDSPAAATPVAPTGPYEGTKTVSSGILGAPQAGSFKVSFDKAGAHTYYCSIHPGMQGKVTVVDAASSAEAQSAIDARAETEKSSFLTEGRAAKKALVEKAPVKKQNADGSTTWTVEMGIGTQHTSVFGFAPLVADIKKGDKVVFVNNSNEPHTASFAGSKSLPQSPESAEAMNAAPGKSPQTLNATNFFNTGWLPPNVPLGGGPPLAVRSYTYNVPVAGTYGYVCLLHALSGMAGSIVAT